MKLRIQGAVTLVAGVLLFLAAQQGCEATQPPDAFVLKGVSFGKHSAALTAGSDGALQQLLQQLQADPSVSIEIQCSVAASGDQQRDAQLSRDRAQTLRRWLMQRGIAFYRLQIADPQTSLSVSEPSEAPRGPGEERIEIVRIHKSFPVAKAPARSYRFEPVVDGQQVLHDFRLLNQGDAPLHISKIRTG